MCPFCVPIHKKKKKKNPSQVWGQDASRPGRLAHPGLFGASLFTVEGQAPDSVYRTWHPGQPHEIVSSSHSITSVSRHGDSVSAFNSSTYSSTGRQSASSSGRSLHHLERAVGSSVWPPGLRTSLSGPVGGAVWRQYRHSCLSSSFRLDVLLHSERHSEGNPSMGRDRPCPSPASVHHGLVQCHRDGGDGRSSPALGQPPSLCLSSDRHHKESSCQTEIFEELRVDSHLSVLASEELVPGPSGTVVQYSHSAAKSKRSSTTAPLPSLSSKSAYASADCMATIKRFARQAGFSSTVAGQLVFCGRQSTRLNYQARWGTYRKWCRDFGHRSSSPSISKIAEFLTYLFKRKGAALSTIKGYRAMLSAVFKFPLLEISTSPILKDLIRSFEISSSRPLFPPPPWDLDKVLEYLSGAPFEPLAKASFLDKTKKALFLLAMATAKRVSELQALSFSVSFQGEDSVLYYDPFFRAKTESAANPLPRSVIVPSLSVICPRGSSALSERLSSSGKLLDQPPIFRPGFSSLLGIRNVPCRRMPFHFIFDS